MSLSRGRRKLTVVLLLESHVPPRASTPLQAYQRPCFSANRAHKVLHAMGMFTPPFERLDCGWRHMRCLRPSPLHCW